MIRHYHSHWHIRMHSDLEKKLLEFPAQPPYSNLIRESQNVINVTCLTLLILHFAHVSVKVESCDPVITRPRLRSLVTSLVMGGEVVITVIRLGTCLPRPCRHLSEI